MFCLAAWRNEAHERAPKPAWPITALNKRSYIRFLLFLQVVFHRISDNNSFW